MTRHVLVEAIIDMVPDGPAWSLEDQMRWFKAAKEAFAVVYNDLPAPPIRTQLALPPPKRRRRAMPSNSLTSQQQAALDTLSGMPKQHDGWVEASIRQIAQACGSSMGSLPYILESLEQKKRIEVEHNGRAGFNRYRVVSP